MEYIIIIPIWLILCSLVASAAKKKGRDGTGYFILALLLSPLIGIIILLISGDSENKIIEKVKKEEKIRADVRNEDSEKDGIILSTSSKYEDLEKLGGLLEKGIISKEEFEVEKKNILSKNIYNAKIKDKVENEEVNSDEIEIFRIINEEINKVTGKLFGSFNYELLNILEEKCNDKIQTLEMLRKYEKLHNENLIEKVKNISSNYNTIKKYLSPFIRTEIVDSQYPHKIIATTNKRK